MLVKIVPMPMHGPEICSEANACPQNFIGPPWYILGMLLIYYYYFNYMWPIHAWKNCADADAWSQNL